MLDGLTVRGAIAAPRSPAADLANQIALAKAGYFAEHNGISHAKVTAPAYELLTKRLIKFGNVLSDGHCAALMGLVGLMTKMAQGQLRGRWAFGLPTGMGKSLSVQVWVATLVNAGLDHISVAVSCSKVEALCEMKRDMIALGVPEDRIGLIHSHGKEASEPSTGDADRQIMLVTHARVRDGNKLAQFSHYQGKLRDLMLYDESLITSDSVGLAVRDLRGCIGWNSFKYRDSEKHQPVLAYLQSCLTMIEDKLQALAEKADASMATEALVTLPPLENHLRATYKTILGRHPANDGGNNLLDISQQQVRVIHTGNGGVVSYTVAMPSELENILVLDASHPVRRLIHLDDTIKDAEKEQQDIKRIAPLAALKQFDKVTVRQMFAGGGRSTMAADFAKPERERKVTREIIEVVKQIPEDEALLIFTYKDRGRETYKDVLLRDLELAGVDTKAKVAGKDRINILTWGYETALNTHSHCEHVILAGIVQRSQADLAGAFLGQTGDLTGKIAYEQVSELINTECAHVAYQALSRGSCRFIDNGHARKMTAWLIHRDASIRTELSKVMPGAVWRTWEPQFGNVDQGVVATTAARIAVYLEQLPASVTKVSTRAIKKEVPELAKVAKMTFTHAIRTIEELAPWRIEGLSLARAF